MTKPELGTKRLCAHCGAKFYDLHHAPIACPRCGRVFEAVQVSSRWRAKAARTPVGEVEPVVAEIPEAQLVSLENADAETEGEEGLGNEAEDGVEPRPASSRSRKGAANSGAAPRVPVRSACSSQSRPAVLRANGGRWNWASPIVAARRIKSAMPISAQLTGWSWS